GPGGRVVGARALDELLSGGATGGGAWSCGGPAAGGAVVALRALRPGGAGRALRTLRARRSGIAFRPLRACDALRACGSLRAGSGAVGARRPGCTLRACGAGRAGVALRPLRACRPDRALDAVGAVRAAGPRAPLRALRAGAALRTLRALRALERAHVDPGGAVPDVEVAGVRDDVGVARLVAGRREAADVLDGALDGDAGAGWALAAFRALRACGTLGAERPLRAFRSCGALRSLRALRAGRAGDERAIAADDQLFAPLVHLVVELVPRTERNVLDRLGRRGRLVEDGGGDRGSFELGCTLGGGARE